MEAQARDMVTDSGSDPVAIGARLREWRVAREMSLSDFADAIGMSKGKVSELERGLFRPGVKAATDIERFCGGAIDAADLNDDVRLSRHGISGSAKGAHDHVG